MRFEVVENHRGKYHVRDTNTGQDLRFGFNVPPLYGTILKPAAEWNNYYSARGFSQRMERLQARHETR